MTLRARPTIKFLKITDIHDGFNSCVSGLGWIPLLQFQVYLYSTLLMSALVIVDIFTMPEYKTPNYGAFFSCYFMIMAPGIIHQLAVHSFYWIFIQSVHHVNPADFLSANYLLIDAAVLFLMMLIMLVKYRPDNSNAPGLPTPQMRPTRPVDNRNRYLEDAISRYNRARRQSRNRLPTLPSTRAPQESKKQKEEEKEKNKEKTEKKEENGGHKMTVLEKKLKIKNETLEKEKQAWLKEKGEMVQKLKAMELRLRKFDPDFNQKKSKLDREKEEASFLKSEADEKKEGSANQQLDEENREMSFLRSETDEKKEASADPLNQNNIQIESQDDLNSGEIEKSVDKGTDVAESLPEGEIIRGMEQLRTNFPLVLN